MGLEFFARNLRAPKTGPPKDSLLPPGSPEKLQYYAHVCVSHMGFSSCACACVYVCVCVYVCMYVCMYVCNRVQTGMLLTFLASVHRRLSRVEISKGFGRAERISPPKMPRRRLLAEQAVDSWTCRDAGNTQVVRSIVWWPAAARRYHAHQLKDGSCWSLQDL